MKLAPLRIAFGMGTFPAVIKESLRMLGVDVGECFRPITPRSDEQKKKLAAILTEMELLHPIGVATP